jgi:hypothetical protein
VHETPPGWLLKQLQGEDAAEQLQGEDPADTPPTGATEDAPSGGPGQQRLALELIPLPALTLLNREGGLINRDAKYTLLKLDCTVTLAMLL